MNPVSVDRNGCGQSVTGHILGSVSQAKVRSPPTCHSCGKGCSLRSYDPKCAATQNSLVEGVLTVGSYE